MYGFFLWMNETSGSIALRESLLMWPLIEAAHVLTLMLFVGTIIMVDLRLLGILFKSVPVSEMDRRILPWTIAGFILMLVTGLLLFYAKPLVYYHSIFFRLKMLILIAALINILVFHFRVQRDQERWDTAPRPPRGARAAAAVSLASWTAMIIAGRLIAYDWYNCEKLDPDTTLHALADCRIAETAIIPGAV